MEGQLSSVADEPQGCEVKDAVRCSNSLHTPTGVDLIFGSVANIIVGQQQVIAVAVASKDTALEAGAREILARYDHLLSLSFD